MMRSLIPTTSPVFQRSRRSVNTSRQRDGFTLMEMMVSLIIAGIMVGLIYVIFNSVTQGVSRGIQVSGFIHSTRMSTDQFHKDFEQLLGPGDVGAGDATGFLVILQHTEPGKMPDPATENTALDFTEDIRRDQISFIRLAYDDRTNLRLHPLAPLSENNFSNDIRAGYARVWYGHIARPGYTETTPMHSTLGRQALLLAAWNTDYAASLAAVPVLNSQLPASPRFAGAYAPFGSAMPHDSVDIQNGPSAAVLSEGYTDLFMLVGAASDFGIAPTDPHPTRYVLDLINNELAGAGSNYNDYRELAYRYTYGVNRLQADAQPDNSVSSWQTGHSHAAFMENVSDFIVDFAADIDASDPGKPDVDVASSGTDINGIAYAYPGGGIKWYSHYANDPTTATFDSTKPITYTPASYAPYDDGSTTLEDADSTQLTNATASFVWMNDTNNGAYVDWPYLLRIRYRLHDKAGRFRSTDPVADSPTNGRWFEIIVPVNRQ